MATKANLFQVDPNGDHTGLLVAVWLDPALANALALPGGEPADQLHVTLCYCGDATEMSDVQIARAIGAVSEVAMMYGPLTGSINGLQRFNGSDSTDGLDVFAAQVDVPMLEAMRQYLAVYLDMADCRPSTDHGYTPHMTLAYIDPGADLPMQRLPTYPFTISAISVGIGDRRTEIPLTGSYQKAGARHSRGDAKMLQTMHDHAVALGASCPGKAMQPQGYGGRSVDLVVLDDPFDANLDTPEAQKRANDWYQSKAEYCYASLKRAVEATGVSKAQYSNALKAISRTNTELRVGNYIVLFGGRDLEGIATKNRNRDGSRGEYFSKSTRLDSPYTSVGHLDVDWEHGYYGDTGEPGPDDILGYVDWKTARIDDKGVFVERVLNRHSEYMKFIEQLIDARMIGTSSEAIGERVQKAANGEIKAWPLRRDTLTVAPMEPRMMTANNLAALKALSQRLPALKSIVDQAERLADPKASRGTASKTVTDAEKEALLLELDILEL